MKDLSIIIISYNTKELLRKCLISLFECIKVSKFQSEILVVDNGSTDGSIEYVRSVIGFSEFAGLKKKENKLVNTLTRNNLIIKLIENQKNLGFARGVNQALRQIESKHILLLNSDVQVKPEALEKLLEFEKEVGPVVIGAKLINPDGTTQPSVFNLPTAGRAIQEYWFGKKNSFSKFFPEGNQPVEVEAVVGGAMLISREIIDKIGLFDERYFMYFEDLDYCRRARKAGFKVYYLPSAKMVHEHGASGRAIPTKTNRWLIESSKIYHGLINYLLITLIIWTSQKWKKFIK